LKLDEQIGFMKLRYLLQRSTLLPLIFIASASSLSAQTFSNLNAITINDNATATPYPSTILVSGVAGNVVKLTISLFQISHSFPDDIDMLLVGPQGQTAVIFSDVGGGPDPQVVNYDITLDDAAPLAMLDTGPLAPGTFQPTNIGTADTFPGPAPGSFSSVSALSQFNGTNPNGTWSLYVVDDAAQDSGSIGGGWSINITVPEPSTWMLVSFGLLGSAALAYVRRRNPGA
jgi:subtilisin-like proprotein convertase family protein